MKNQYPVIINENSVSIFKGANRLVAHKNHPCFQKIIKRIRENNFNGIEQLFKIKDTFERLFNVTVKNNSEVFYKGKKLHNTLTDKIINCIRQDLPYKSWINFLNRLMDNPSDYCREQLFSYVEKHGCPICSEGFLWGYRAVRKDYFDHHTGKTHKYLVGKIIKMDRDKCETDENVGCGTGLHLAAAEYLDQYYNKDTSRYLLCRFSPKDCMSVPTDSDFRKLRVCKLRVMREVKREDIIPLGDTYMGKNGRVKPKRNELGQFVSV